MKGFADELVGDVRTVELGGVDVVDTQFNRAAQNGDSLAMITRRPEHAGTGELHRAETDASDGELSESKSLHM
ncbi:MAG: hypothetical protein NVS4B6_09710 [Mycobacterium sp.]